MEKNQNSFKVCCIFNYAPHYRLPIFQLMGDKLKVDFYFCDRLPYTDSIKKIDYKLLPTFKKELKLNKLRSRNLWDGLFCLAFKPYKIFIITPDYRSPSQWLFLLACKLMGKKVVAWWHGVAPGYNGNGKDWKEMKRFFRHLDGNFIYGDKAREYMEKINFPAKNKITIYNSLDYEVSLSKRNENLLSPIYKDYFGNEYPILLFIGRLTKIKKLDMLIAAHEMLIEKGIKTNVVFIGSGEDTNNLKNSIPTERRDYFWFRGAVYNENEISIMLYNADLCVSPGNVGLTSIHALYYGLPTLTNNNFLTQMPEHECIIPGKTGDFFEDGSIESMTAKIEEWFTAAIDRDEIRNKCYEVADRCFNPYKQIEVIKQMIKIFE